MPVLTISRQMGSGGDKIAQETAKLLGWSYFDKDLLRKAAAESGLSVEHVVDFNEDSYPVRDFWDRLLGGADKIAMARFKEVDENGTVILTEDLLDEERCLAFIQSTLYHLKDKGNIVIIGRGGQALFREYDGAFHVRIIARMEKRIEEMMMRAETTKEEAAEYLKKRDTAASQYIRRFYNENWEDPMLYHMVVNSSFIDEDTAAEVLADAVRKYFTCKEIPF
ncbi:MAG: cytidylate kinase-like family protein [Chloroflexi bacterium]|nr:cytidylate kinase-like family protein [Chloroflexota bacterium]